MNGLLLISWTKQTNIRQNKINTSENSKNKADFSANLPVYNRLPLSLDSLGFNVPYFTLVLPSSVDSFARVNQLTR